MRADRILALDIFPWVGSGLFEAEGNAFAFGIDFYNHYGNFFADLQHFARVGDSAPAHVGDMQQAVEAVEVDKRSVIGDILDDAPADVAGLDFREECAALFGALFFDELAAGNDDIFAFRVNFYHLEIVCLPNVLVEVLRGLDVYLRSGQEGVHAYAYDEASLYFALYAAGENCAFLAVGENFFPIFLLLRFIVRDYGVALAVFKLFKQYFYFLSDLYVVDIRKFVYRNDTFGFSAYVNYYFVLADFDYFALYYRALFEFGKAAVSQQFFHYVVHLCPCGYCRLRKRKRVDCLWLCLRKICAMRSLKVK